MGNIIRVSRAFARFVGKYAYSAPNIAAHRLTACDDKAFLLFENLDQSTWSGRLSESRENYSRRRQRLLQGLEHPEEIESTTDPLADDEEVRSFDSLSNRVFIMFFFILYIMVSGL